MGGASFWMSAKYNALQTHADAAYLAAQAAMTEAQSHAGMLNPAQAAALRASGFKTTEEGKMVKPAAEAGIAGQKAQTADQLAMTDWRRSNPNYGWFGIGTGMYGPGAGMVDTNKWLNAPIGGGDTAPVPSAPSSSYAAPEAPTPSYGPAPTPAPSGVGSRPAPGAGMVSPPTTIGSTIHVAPGAEAQRAPPAISYSGPGFSAIGAGQGMVNTQNFGYPASGLGASLPHYAGGTPDVQPNFGAWGAPGVASSPAAPTFLGAPLVAAGTHYNQAGYFNGVPAPSGSTGYAAPPATAANSSNNTRLTNQQVPNNIPPGTPPATIDPWGFVTPLGHSRVTGEAGSFSDLGSIPVQTYVDGGQQRGGSNRRGAEDSQQGRSTSGGSNWGGSSPQWAKGTSKVPAKGHGKGMVKAKVAPGEAVLTPGAADHMGRDNIGMLNAMAHHGALSSQKVPGAQPQSIGKVQGIPPPSPQALQMAAMMQGGGGGAPPAGGPPGFAEGTSNVSQKALKASGDNGTKMGKDTEAKGFEYAHGGPPAPGYAKGSSNVQQIDDSIGKQVKLGKGKEKAPPDLSLAKGTSKVPGKPTHPSKDTVNAELPPGGAVLTNDAANHVGRGLIAHLNQLHSGMPKPGFAEGTSNVYADDPRINPNAPTYTPFSANDLGQGAGMLANDYQNMKGAISKGTSNYNTLLNALTIR